MTDHYVEWIHKNAASMGILGAALTQVRQQSSCGAVSADEVMDGFGREAEVERKVDVGCVDLCELQAPGVPGYSNHDGRSLRLQLAGEIALHHDRLADGKSVRTAASDRIAAAAPERSSLPPKTRPLSNGTPSTLK